MLRINILTDLNSWINSWIKKFKNNLNKKGYIVLWTHEHKQLSAGDLCFMLSYEKVVGKQYLGLNSHNLVVHESSLPNGKGWSPLTWQVLEGAHTIPVTLFEAEESVDSGPIYLQEYIHLKGHELVNELRDKQAKKTIKLCNKFINNYPSIIKEAKPQIGNETFYNRRLPSDSKLDPNKSISEQFNLLRVVDNDSYPAFFEFKGNRYILKIEKQKQK